MSTKPTQAYNESSIRVLKGLEPVQQRPGMYTRLETPTHIILEVIDNACDEALAGHAKNIYVKVFGDHSVSIADDGRGIPCGMHPEEKAPVVELVFTQLHSGGKFDKGDGASAYKYSGGLHGVGVSVTNALSDRLEVRVKREGAEHFMAFEKGHVVEPVHKVGKAEKGVSGTVVRAWPTSSYFDQPHVSVSELESTLRSKAMLLPGVVMTFEVEGKEPLTWHYPEGMPQYLNDVTHHPEWLFPPLSIDGTDVNPDGGEDGLTCVLGFTTESSPHRESFVNLIPTKDGGKHMQGLRYGAFQAVQQFMERQGLIPKNIKIEYDDVWNRMSGVLAMRMVDPQFQGQTKDLLSSKHASKLVEKIVSAQFELWLHEHPQFAKPLAELIAEQAISRSKTAQKSERKKSVGGSILPGKLSDCESNDVKLTELFLVEGDSAGGCFFYDTSIPLADGRTINVKQMCSEQDSGIRHFVFTCDPDGKVKIEEALHARITRRDASLVEILLDNGKKIICTPDHKFMLRDGTYLEATRLSPGQSLMPYYTQKSNSKGRIGYTQIYDQPSSSWVYAHGLADQWNLAHGVYPFGRRMDGERRIRIDRHHIDFNKLNNNPTNIVRMDSIHHISLHQDHCRKTLGTPEVLAKIKATMNTPEFKEANRLRTMAHPSWDKFQKSGAPEHVQWRLNNPDAAAEKDRLASVANKKHWESEENRQAQSERTALHFQTNPEARIAHSNIAKEQWSDESLRAWRAEETRKQWTDEFRAQRTATLAKTYYNKTIACLKLFVREDGTVDVNAYHASEEYKKKLLKWSTFCEKYFDCDEAAATQAVVLFNHKVVSVTPLDYTSDVYDIEVPNTHNFATDAGVFIHNSAKMGRDRKHQAILPLRGKLLNTWGIESDNLISKTIDDIISVIGVEPHEFGSTVSFDNLRYGKIIIMSDADVDGRHIQVLLLTLFIKHFPELVRRGHVYLAQPPLFRVDAPHSKKAKNPMRKMYALDQGELDGIFKKLRKEGLDESHWTVNRFKGLGEMNAEQLSETTMDVSSRRLVQPMITEADWKQTCDSFDMMMNDKNAHLRRAWMEKHGNTADVDI
jgi:DNA gyrase subunit B